MYKDYVLNMCVNVSLLIKLMMLLNILIILFTFVMQSDVLLVLCSEQLRFVTQPNLLDSFVKK